MSAMAAQHRLTRSCLMLRQGGAATEGMAGDMYLRRYMGAGLLLQAAVLYTLKVRRRLWVRVQGTGYREGISTPEPAMGLQPALGSMP